MAIGQYFFNYILSPLREEFWTFFGNQKLMFFSTTRCHWCIIHGKLAGISPIMDDLDILLLSSAYAACSVVIFEGQRKKKRVKRLCWVRPYLRRRDSQEHSNMLHLYKELLNVTIYKPLLSINT